MVCSVSLKNASSAIPNKCANLKKTSENVENIVTGRGVKVYPS